MWRLRQIPTVTTVVQQVVGRTECFDFTNEQIIPRAELPLGPEPGWWFLFDSTAPPIGLGPAVLVTSPKCEILWLLFGYFILFFFGNIYCHLRYEIWKQFDRQNNARKFVMPVWSYAELCACRNECFPAVSEEFVKEAFARWCVPPWVLLFFSFLSRVNNSGVGSVGTCWPRPGLPIKSASTLRSLRPTLTRSSRSQRRR
jgi:hypothetical protein